MPKLTVLANGNLEISVTEEEHADLDWDKLCKGREENALNDLLENIFANSEWQLIGPEDIGALTDAPIICDGVDFPDSGAIVAWGNVWWYPNYMVSNCIEQLRDHRSVIFTRGGDAVMPVDCELCQRQGCTTCNNTGMILWKFEKPGVSWMQETEERVNKYMEEHP